MSSQALKPSISAIDVDTTAPSGVDSTHKASLPLAATSETKPSLSPINSALKAYNANLPKKRPLQESSDSVPVEPAVKGRAVEPGSYRSMSTTAVAASTCVYSSALPSRSLSPRHVFDSIYGDAFPQKDTFAFSPWTHRGFEEKGHNYDQTAKNSRNFENRVNIRSHSADGYAYTNNNRYGPCKYYHSTFGCRHTPCIFSHNTYEIGSAGWIRTREDLVDMTRGKFDVPSTLTPNPCLGLLTGFTDIEHTGTDDDKRTIVSYCMNSFTKTGCTHIVTTNKDGTKNECPQCHEAPLYGTLEWVNLKKQISRYWGENPGLELSENADENFNKPYEVDVADLLNTHNKQTGTPTETDARKNGEIAGNEKMGSAIKNTMNVTDVDSTTKKRATRSIEAPIVDRAISSNRSAGSTTTAEARSPSRQSSMTSRTTASMRPGTPCVYFHSVYGCDRHCNYVHAEPEVGSEAWWDLRDDLVRCVQTLKRDSNTLIPNANLGLDAGFKRPIRASYEPLVDYCYPFFTTLGCPSSKCTRYHHLPVERSSEWALFKEELIRYLYNRLDRDPYLDFTPQIKARGVTKAMY